MTHNKQKLLIAIKGKGIFEAPNEEEAATAHRLLTRFGINHLYLSEEALAQRIQRPVEPRESIFYWKRLRTIV